MSSSIYRDCCVALDCSGSPKFDAKSSEHSNVVVGWGGIGPQVAGRSRRRRAPAGQPCGVTASGTYARLRPDLPDLTSPVSCSAFSPLSPDLAACDQFAAATILITYVHVVTRDLSDFLSTFGLDRASKKPHNLNRDFYKMGCQPCRGLSLWHRK